MHSDLLAVSFSVLPQRKRLSIDKKTMYRWLDITLTISYKTSTNCFRLIRTEKEQAVFWKLRTRLNFTAKWVRTSQCQSRNIKIKKHQGLWKFSEERRRMRTLNIWFRIFLQILTVLWKPNNMRWSEHLLFSRLKNKKHISRLYLCTICKILANLSYETRKSASYLRRMFIRNYEPAMKEYEKEEKNMRRKRNSRPFRRILECEICFALFLYDIFSRKSCREEVERKSVTRRRNQQSRCANFRSVWVRVREREREVMSSGLVATHVTSPIIMVPYFKAG